MTEFLHDAQCIYSSLALDQQRLENVNEMKLSLALLKKAMDSYNRAP